jgi:hypothetical protein
MSGTHHDHVHVHRGEGYRRDVSRPIRAGMVLRNGEGGAMGETIDTSKGWCCDGRTWVEHASEDGDCCQSEGTQIEDLPQAGQEQAKARLAED